jgi:predicted thioesterase
MRGEASVTVDQAHTASATGSGNLPTLGLPALIALCERAAAQAIRRGLEPGEETVGTMVHLRYLAPVSQGKRIRAEAVVTAVDGRKVTFEVRASDSKGPIGEGTHERTVVDRDEFIWQTATRGA